MSWPVLYPYTERPFIPPVADDAIADESIAWGDGSAIAGIAIAGLGVAGTGIPGVATTPFSSLGHGVLSDTISCYVTEQRNGSYELKMTYPYTGPHFRELKWRRIILAKPNFNDDPQPFRIYKVTKALNGICTVYARHLSYDLTGMEMPYGKTASTCSAACSLLSGWAAPFTITTNKSVTSTFRSKTPGSVRSWMGGKAGSLLDLYGGEWQYDKYTCTLKTSRGQDRGVVIRYGKNLTALTHDEDSSELYTAVRAFWADQDGNVVEGDPVSTGITLDSDKSLVIDVSGDFDETPSVADLTASATTYIAQNTLNVPKVNLALDFVQLNSLPDRVDLCDTVSVYFEELGVSAKVKCIETTWDVLKDRYSGTKFGEPLANITDTIANLARR